MNPLRWLKSLFTQAKPNEPPKAQALANYRALVDKLRQARQKPGWTPIQDRPVLALLEDLYPLLTEAEQEVVEREGLRDKPSGVSQPTPLPQLDRKAIDAFYAVRNQCPKCRGVGSIHGLPCRRCLASGRYHRPRLPPEPHESSERSEPLFPSAEMNHPITLDPPCDASTAGHIWFATDDGWLCSLCGARTFPSPTIPPSPPGKGKPKAK